MDPELVRVSGAIAASVGGALAAKPLLEKLLGPSFDYIGGAIASLLERYGNVNVHEIFRRAAAKLSSSSDAGCVNPKVLRIVIEDGSFANDDVTREYFASLLAASFSQDPADDRAVTFLAVVRNLTTTQIRVHHLFYSFLRQYHITRRVSIGGTDALTLFIPDQALKDLAGITSRSLLRNAVYGLVRNELLCA